MEIIKSKLDWGIDFSGAIATHLIEQKAIEIIFLIAFSFFQGD
jgi:hypothetical protein